MRLDLHTPQHRKGGMTRSILVTLRHTLGRCQGVHRPRLREPWRLPQSLPRCTRGCCMLALLIVLIAVALTPTRAEDMDSEVSSSSSPMRSTNNESSTAKQPNRLVESVLADPPPDSAYMGHDAEPRLSSLDTHSSTQPAPSPSFPPHAPSSLHKTSGSNSSTSSAHSSVSFHVRGSNYTLYIFTDEEEEAEAETEAEAEKEEQEDVFTRTPPPSLQNNSFTTHIESVTHPPVTNPPPPPASPPRPQPRHTRETRQRDYTAAMRALYLDKNLTRFVAQVVRGAAAHHPRLQWLLGVLSAHGVGVPYNESRAHALYTAAAAGGVAEAHAALLHRARHDPIQSSLEQRCRPAHRESVQWLARHIRETGQRRLVDSRWLPPPYLQVEWIVSSMGDAAVGAAYYDSDDAAAAEEDGWTASRLVGGGNSGARHRGRMAVDALQRLRYSEARHYMQALAMEADEGQVHAMLKLGSAYLYGMVGLRPNRERSRRYLREALKREGVSAAAAWGAMGMWHLNGHEHGEPVSLRDVQKAHGYFVQGMKRQDSASYLGMAWLYVNGYLRRTPLPEQERKEPHKNAMSADAAATGGGDSSWFGETSRSAESPASPNTAHPEAKDRIIRETVATAEGQTEGATLWLRRFIPAEGSDKPPLHRGEDGATTLEEDYVGAPAEWRYAVRLLTHCTAQGSVDCKAFLTDVICSRPGGGEACQSAPVSGWLTHTSDRLSTLWHNIHLLSRFNDLLTCQVEYILLDRIQQRYAEWRKPYSPSAELVTADWLDYDILEPDAPEKEAAVTWQPHTDSVNTTSRTTNANSTNSTNAPAEWHDAAAAAAAGAALPGNESSLGLPVWQTARVDAARRVDERHMRLLNERRHMAHCAYDLDDTCAVWEQKGGEGEEGNDEDNEESRNDAKQQEDVASSSSSSSPHTRGTKHASSRAVRSEGMSSSLYSFYSRLWLPRWWWSNGVRAFATLARRTRLSQLPHFFTALTRRVAGNWFARSPAHTERDMDEDAYGVHASKSMPFARSAQPTTTTNTNPPPYSLPTRPRRRSPLVSLIESLALAETGHAAAVWQVIELLDDVVHVPGEFLPLPQAISEGVVDAHNASLAPTQQQQTAAQQRDYARWLHAEMREDCVQLHWSGRPAVPQGWLRTMHTEEGERETTRGGTDGLAVVHIPSPESVDVHAIKPNVSTLDTALGDHTMDASLHASGAGDEHVSGLSGDSATDAPDGVASNHPGARLSASSASSSSSSSSSLRPAPDDAPDALPLTPPLLPTTPPPLSQREAKQMLRLHMLQSPLLRHDGDALRQLGDVYYYGTSHSLGVDLDQALVFYEAAARHNNSHGIFSAAVMHQLELFGAPARKWNKAAQSPRQRVLYSLRLLLTAERAFPAERMRTAHRYYAQLTHSPYSAVRWMARWGVISLHLQEAYTHLMTHELAWARQALHRALTQWGVTMMADPAAAAVVAAPVPPSSHRDGAAPQRVDGVSSSAGGLTSDGAATRSAKSDVGEERVRWGGGGRRAVREWWNRHVRRGWSGWREMGRNVAWVKVVQWVEKAVLVTSVTVWFTALLIRQHAI